mmetsp:Transcript_8246/g.11413  ORF Transcript_8246/g.11413 Transcript_8246/m.11413 type:complete len:214 (-) Transcript_8246:2503-3144(-)
MLVSSLRDSSGCEGRVCWCCFRRVHGHHVHLHASHRPHHHDYLHATRLYHRLVGYHHGRNLHALTMRQHRLRYRCHDRHRRQLRADSSTCMHCPYLETLSDNHHGNLRDLGHGPRLRSRVNHPCGHRSELDHRRLDHVYLDELSPRLCLCHDHLGHLSSREDCHCYREQLPYFHCCCCDRRDFSGSDCLCRHHERPFCQLARQTRPYGHRSCQ